MERIPDLIRSLGINGRYLGYRYLIEAVEMVAANEDILLSVCSRLYPVIADKYETSSDNVERNLRTVVNTCWEKGNRSMLKQIFPYPLEAKPSSAELIDALAVYWKDMC